MSDHEHPQNTTNHELKASIKDKAEIQLNLINEFIEHIGGEGTHIDDVLPQPMTKPSEARQDSPDPNWNDEQIARARELAHQFGYGAEQNVGSGLSGGARIVEGGLAWKIAAELSAATQEDNVQALVFAGSAHRTLRDDERQFIESKLKIEGLSPEATEYDFVKALARAQSAEPNEADTVLPFGYQVAEGNQTVSEATGQLIGIGQSTSGQEVLVLRIDREDYEEEGKAKYRYQPSSEAVMSFVSDLLTAQGDVQSPIGLITSNAYASRIPEAMRAGLKNGREFGVAMYGRATLAEVKGEEIKPDTPLNQLPGDLRVMHDSLQKLSDELA